MTARDNALECCRFTLRTAVPAVVDAAGFPDHAATLASNSTASDVYRDTLEELLALTAEESRQLTEHSGNAHHLTAPTASGPSAPQLARLRPVARSIRLCV